MVEAGKVGSWSSCDERDHDVAADTLVEIDSI